jgi:hypothetical protein
MVHVKQWSGCIERSNSRLSLNIRDISGVIKIAMGNLAGISDLISDLNATVELVCETSSCENRFVLADMSSCGTNITGISMYADVRSRGVGCFTYHCTKFHCKMISATVCESDSEKIADIREYFDDKFKKIIKPRLRPSALCGVKEVAHPPVFKDYVLELKS